MRESNHSKYIRALYSINIPVPKKIDPDKLKALFSKNGLDMSKSEFFKNYTDHDHQNFLHMTKKAISEFEELSAIGYMDSDIVLESFKKKYADYQLNLDTQLNQIKKDFIAEKYNKGMDYLSSSKDTEIEIGIKILKSINGYIDFAKDIIGKSQSDIDKIVFDAESKIKMNNQKRRKTIAFVVSTSVIFVGILYVITKVIIPSNKYKNAVQYFEEGDYASAANLFSEIKNYKDSVSQKNESNYQLALRYYNNEQFAEAKEIFQSLNDYKDSSLLFTNSENAIIYQNALDDIKNGEYTEAYAALYTIQSYKDSKGLLETMQLVPISATDKNHNYGTYDFTYDKNGALTAISHAGDGHDYSITQFNDTGKVISSKYKYISNSDYTTNTDGTITWTATSSNVTEKKVYDRYGVMISEYNGQPVHIQVDSNHNPTKTSYNSEIINTYTSIFGNSQITNVSKKTSSFEFEYIAVLNNEQYPIDIIWRNIRMVCHFIW